MKALRNIAVVPVLAISLASVGMHTTASATPAAGSNCVLELTGSKNTVGNPDSRFTLNNDGTVSAEVTLSGRDCVSDIVIASWQAPDADKGLPYSAQKLFKYSTVHLSSHTASQPDTKTLTVELPNCFYQVDVAPGSSPTDANGGPQYNVVDGRKLIGSLHGGTTACETGGKGGGDVTTTTPTPTATAAATVLPNTGNSAVATISALVAVVSASAIAFRIRLARKTV